MTVRKAWTPSWRVHPGESVREAREASGLSLRAAAARMGIHAPFLSDIEHGRRAVGPRMALRLEALGWGTAEFWVRMQGTYDLAKEREHFRSGEPG